MSKTGPQSGSDRRVGGDPTINARDTVAAASTSGAGAQSGGSTASRRSWDASAFRSRAGAGWSWDYLEPAPRAVRRARFNRTRNLSIRPGMKPGDMPARVPPGTGVVLITAGDRRRARGPPARSNAPVALADVAVSMPWSQPASRDARGRASELIRPLVLLGWRARHRGRASEGPGLAPSGAPPRVCSRSPPRRFARSRDDD